MKRQLLRQGRMGGMCKKEKRKNILSDFIMKPVWGEEYKAAIEKKIDAFFQNLDLKKIQLGHVEAVKIRTAEPHRKIVSFAESYTESMIATIGDYMKYVTEDSEKQNVLRWARQTKEILPNRLENINFYADILYLWGDKQEAIKLKEEACRLAKDDELGQKIKAELRKMIAK